MSVKERESVLERIGAARQIIALLPEQVKALAEKPPSTDNSTGVG